MAFEGILLHAIKTDIENTLLHTRITRIYQPTKDELLFYFNDANKSALVISCGNAARVYIGNKYANNPSTPLPFCMAMRKYLMNAKLTRVRQIHFDRVLELDFEGTDQIGSFTNLTLNIEVMGRYSNITLYDTHTKIIIDALKHIPPTPKNARIILPKTPFTYAPSKKLDPTDFSVNAAMDLASFHLHKGKDALLMHVFNGLGLSSSTEIALRLAPKGDAWPQEYDALKTFFINVQTFFADLTQQFSYIIYTDENGKRVDFSVLTLQAYKNYSTLSFPCASAMVEEFYKNAAKEKSLATQYDYILKAITTKLEKEKKNLKIRQNDLERTENYEQYNLKGQLLLCNLHALKKGQTRIILPNLFSEENEPIEIPLSPKCNGKENAQQYFKKFHKAKRTQEFLSKFIVQTQQMIAFLEETLASFYMSETETDMQNIQKILMEKGILKKNTKKIVPSNKQKGSDTLVFFSERRNRILIGKNAKANEKLSLRHADKDHYWFHVKDHGGSHVVLESQSPPSDEEIKQCALLAAYYSSQKDEKNVPIDYTQLKYVKRHPSLIAGLVTYTHNKTISVTPTQNEIFYLREQSHEQQTQNH